jgi:hypothetical protein
MAQSHDLIRNIVRYLRLRKRVKVLDSIQETATDGKVFPLFSQVRLAHGGIASTEPKLIDPDMVFENDFIKAPAIRRRLPQRKRALDMLQAVTGDRALEADRKTGRAAFIGGIDPNPEVDHGDLLLSTAIDLSTAALCRRFLVQPPTVASLRGAMRSRYGTLFGWLDEYRRQAQANGFASWEGRRKYLEGLRSSDLNRRAKAVRSATRWLIGI